MFPCPFILCQRLGFWGNRLQDGDLSTGGFLGNDPQKTTCKGVREAEWTAEKRPQQYSCHRQFHKKLWSWYDPYEMPLIQARALLHPHWSVTGCGLLLRWRHNLGWVGFLSPKASRRVVLICEMPALLEKWAWFSRYNLSSTAQHPLQSTS